jgi:hypothetical protein
VVGFGDHELVAAAADLERESECRPFSVRPVLASQAEHAEPWNLAGEILSGRSNTVHSRFQARHIAARADISRRSLSSASYRILQPDIYSEWIEADSPAAVSPWSAVLRCTGMSLAITDPGG